MKCEQIRGLLDRAQSGETEILPDERIHEHLAACADCSREYFRLKSALDHLPGLPRFSEGYWDRYSRGILARLKPAGKMGILRRWAPVMAGALVLIGGGTYYYQSNESHETSEIISHLDVLEHLDLLERDDFEEVIRNENEQGFID